MPNKPSVTKAALAMTDHLNETRNNPQEVGQNAGIEHEEDLQTHGEQARRTLGTKQQQTVSRENNVHMKRRHQNVTTATPTYEHILEPNR